MSIYRLTQAEEAVATRATIYGALRWVRAAIAVYTLLGTSVQAHAMCCGSPPSAAQALEEADAVFVGEIQGAGRLLHPLWCTESLIRQILGKAHGDEICMGGYVRFAVLEQFKGELGAQVTLDTDWPVTLREPMSAGATLLIYTPRDSYGRLRLWGCGRALMLSRAADDLTLLRANRANAER
jgi:hypothetical protein